MVAFQSIYRFDSHLDPYTITAQPPTRSLTMTSPTKRDHTARLLAQIAELSAQRDQLITEMLPLIPADVLASAQKPSNVASATVSDDPAEPTFATAKSAKSDKEASPFAYLATTTNNPTAESPAPPADAGPSSPGQGDATLSESTRAAVLAHAEHTVKQHISRLHAYNGIRDIGQNVMGLLAEQRGIRVVQVMEECGVGEGD